MRIVPLRAWAFNLLPAGYSRGIHGDTVAVDTLQTTDGYAHTSSHDQVMCHVGGVAIQIP